FSLIKPIGLSQKKSKMEGSHMKVQDVMTKNVRSCRTDTSLAEAAAMMWDNDCGVVPVIEANGKVVGVITDRDVCMAVATKNRLPSDIRVSETISYNIDACLPDDDVRSALKVMQKSKVRRLPIVNREGNLQGLLSLNDIILKVDKGGGKDISSDDIITTL